jgi:amidophosphoribosyltransferase
VTGISASQSHNIISDPKGGKYMGGFFAVASKESCVLDLFFGTDYHSHLGTRRAGMAVYGEKGFDRAIHNIQNSPFRTKFDSDVNELEGNLGIGCISDFEPQPLLVNSHLGSFAITTVGKINNADTLVGECFQNGHTHFLEMSGGTINPTEIAAALINQQSSIVDGLKYVHEKVDGSLTVLLLTPEGIYASRDRLGRTPVVIGHKEGAFCAAFESFSYLNLGYEDYRELGPGEIVLMTPDGVETQNPPGEEMKICSFLWVYYGYPTSCYEGVNVEDMRYECGRLLAKRDNVQVDSVAGVPDSGIAHAIGYSNESRIPFTRPFIKYTPTWPRSFMPTNQAQRNLIARMKLIPVHKLIKGKSLLLIDDSIVRGTQLRETTEFLYRSGAREVHIRPACPPIMFGCKYLNFSRSSSDLDLIARRVILRREGERADQVLDDYANPDSQNYNEMVEDIRKELNFTSLRFHRLDDMIQSIGISPCKLCTYCWNGKE